MATRFALPVMVLHTDRLSACCSRTAVQQPKLAYVPPKLLFLWPPGHTAERQAWLPEAGPGEHVSGLKDSVWLGTGASLLL